MAIPRKDISPGMRFVSKSMADSLASPITVTEMTERGFRYKLDERRILFARTGSYIEGGEMFLHDGKLHGYERAV